MQDWQTASRDAWDSRSESWQSSSAEMWDMGTRRDIIPFFQRHVPIDTVGWVLDAGCGDGYGSAKLAQAGYRVLGVDFSPVMIEAAGKRASESLKFEVADVTKLPYDDQAFAAIMSINALEWTEQPLKGLREFQRVLQPGGTLVLGVLGPTAGPRLNSFRRLYGEPVICNTMMPWECARLCEEDGWHIVDGLPVFKPGVDIVAAQKWPIDLQQALTFLWVFVMKKEAGSV